MNGPIKGYAGDLRPPPSAEPAWTAHGTYMTLRVSTFDTATWDRSSQNDQERSVGRFKVSGASLDLSDDPARIDESPAFVADQSSTVVPLDSHVRKSNPRRSEEDALRRIFRRGYPLIQTAPGGSPAGLFSSATGGRSRPSSSSSRGLGFAIRTSQRPAPGMTGSSFTASANGFSGAATTSFRRVETPAKAGVGRFRPRPTLRQADGP